MADTDTRIGVGPETGVNARVGIRRLRAELAHFVGRAASGETIVVTVDGNPTAQLAPLGQSDVGSLDQLARNGRAQRPADGQSQMPVKSHRPAGVVVGNDVNRMLAQIRG